ncbi:MAG: metal ABC transporter ATP-binding protein [Treponema sp.]|jgi:zinc transport system ATP-binding protein|nr:metal ABC transporter ATP-binding protein [Treponema sp.]
MAKPEAVFKDPLGKNSLPFHPLHRRVALEFEGVSFSYGETKVLENAAFHIHEGEFVALVGPNGSGKTTVLKLLLGLQTPDTGRIDLFGARVGYVPQQPPGDEIFPISVRDVVRMGRLLPFRLYSKKDRAAAEDALRQAEIFDLADRPYGALSGGQRRRVLVARALAAGPDILILDEPTANMDAESGERLFEILGKLKGKATILIVTHDTDFVSSLTDRVLCMGDGGEPRYGGGRGILQHRTEAEARGVSRVIHGGGVPAGLCYGEGGGESCGDGDGRS